MAMAAPAGSSADLTASAGWAVQLGKLITQLHLPVLCGHGFFPFSILYLLLMRTPSDAITHFLNYKNVSAILFPLVPFYFGMIISCCSSLLENPVFPCLFLLTANIFINSSFSQHYSVNLFERAISFLLRYVCMLSCFSHVPVFVIL